MVPSIAVLCYFEVCLYLISKSLWELSNSPASRYSILPNCLKASTTWFRSCHFDVLRSLIGTEHRFCLIFEYFDLTLQSQFAFCRVRNSKFLQYTMYEVYVLGLNVSYWSRFSISLRKTSTISPKMLKTYQRAII